MGAATPTIGTTDHGTRTSTRDGGARELIMFKSGSRQAPRTSERKKRMPRNLELLQNTQQQHHFMSNTIDPANANLSPVIPNREA